MKNVYIYDGDFLSLLNTITYLLKNNLKPENIKKYNYNPTLFENIINLSINLNEEIIEKAITHFGTMIVSRMYYVFLSEEENKELIIYYFFRNALKYSNKVLYYRNLKCVSEVWRISNYVIHETHKLKGFLRFKELEKNVLYAEMEPTNDILFLISCHFKKRLNNEFWIIKDNKRKIFSIYDKKEFIIVREEEFEMTIDKESSNEKEIEKLWKIFYKTIGIKERKNDRCRQNFMPKKYWKYITEVREEL